MMIDGLNPADAHGDAGESRPARHNATRADHCASPPPHPPIQVGGDPDRESDIAGVAGVSGLIKTLEKTTLQLAVLAVAIALIGFAVTLVQGNELYTYWSSAIAVVVLIYCYPTKSSWQKTVKYFTDPKTEPVTE